MNWKDIVVSFETTIVRVLGVIDSSAMQIALIVDRQYKLLGTVTDGDIRRAILKGVSLQEPVGFIMNRNPICLTEEYTQELALNVMRQKNIRHLPIVDSEGRIVFLETLNHILEPDPMDHWVVLMAGGLGTRLMPLTENCPKPLLPIGGKPLLETIIENFKSYGFTKFYISVNYKAEMVEDYFGDGSKWGVVIRYIREDQRMGTAGALSLLPSLLTSPLVIMNGDLLTKTNFKHLVDFHSKENTAATMCVREYEYQVPYGVVEVRKNRFVNIVEKPLQRYYVSAGIYVLNPNVIEYIPRNTYYDMPTLFASLSEQEIEAAIYSIREYWMDIGRIDDFQKANNEYRGVFE
ncbi:nucleotidyltransferase family protein [Paenibacillus oryzisoli]|uniref:Alcohol dehydrogenase n=1 Tax=Paenibacillus oryzisoli TaxID=1850517 RepID=A0A198A0H4_9BACL|nr:nucleotidyltransferase family protein [Paenibacillus oryzisoli]OAS14521.1 alcohol dehydrogenase [Paenibacillus oryzisoli]